MNEKEFFATYGKNTKWDVISDFVLVKIFSTILLGLWSAGVVLIAVMVTGVCFFRGIFK